MSRGGGLCDEWRAGWECPSMCAARGSVRTRWASILSLQRQAVHPVRVGFIQSVHFGRLRRRLLQLPTMRPGPAERPGRSPRVPATASEAELRAAVAMAATLGPRVHPSANCGAVLSCHVPMGAMMDFAWCMALCRWSRALHPTLGRSWPTRGAIVLVGRPQGSWTLRLRAGRRKVFHM